MLIAMPNPLVSQKEANRSYSSSIPPSSLARMQEASNTDKGGDRMVSPTGTKQQPATARPEQLHPGGLKTPPHKPLSIPPSIHETSSPTASYRRIISSPVGSERMGSPLTLLPSVADSSKLNQPLSSPTCTSTPLFAYAGIPMAGEQFHHPLTTTPPPYNRPPPTTHVYFARDRASPSGPAGGATPPPVMASTRSHHRHTLQYQQQQQQIHWNSTGVGSSSRSGAAPTSTGTPRSIMSQPIHAHGPRTPPEVLKTLLRKKACLYEAGTSYAIAIVTWLVGRSLTLSHGYFSRQQLQYGVHQAVSDIIDSGNITRTKVNRCMQIILNSCFHYVIPHPKTDEVSSRRFKDKFQSVIEHHDDAYYLLQTLDPPWDTLDLTVAMEDLLKHTDESDSIYNLEHEEDGMNRREQPAAMKSSQKGEISADINDDGSCSTKRTVLLCFNENVTSFEDVWRCHNEFIRDVARAGNLKLTAQEWKDFFSRDVIAASSHARTVSSRTAASIATTSHSFTAETSSEDGSCSLGSSPRLPPLHPSPGSLSQPSVSNRATTLPVEPLIPELFLDGRQQQQYHHPHSYAAAVAAIPHIDDDKHSAEIDQRFGVMDDNELCKFRTQWCTKRYDHDPRVCTFAHTKVNQGWLRRNPRTYSYKDEFCPNILTISRPGHFLDGCFFNMCPEGINCAFCHSLEEMEYHPNRYKHQKQLCPTFLKVSKDGGDLFDSCFRDQTCPFVHPIVKPPHSGTIMMHSRTSSDGITSSGGGLRYSSSSSGRAQHHPRSPRLQGKSSQDGSFPPIFTRDTAAPTRSPMIYISPAPESMFEKSLALPGLKSIFRQHSAVLYSYVFGGAPPTSQRMSLESSSTRAPVASTDQRNISLYQFF